MKSVLFSLILVLVFSPICAQKVSVPPKSKVINAAKLLKDIETLSADDMQGRGIGTEGSAKAREYVVARFKEAGIKSFGETYLYPFEFSIRSSKKFSGTNVLGFIEGKKFKDKYIVISAHYDHVGMHNGAIYNGADDNASGTSALFALAAYFTKHKPSHTIIFAAFDGEESGLRGSKKFVETPPVAKEKIVMNINMDMIAHNDKNELYASGTYHNPQFKPLLEKLAKNAKVKLLFGHDQPEEKLDDWTNQSDHGSFHAAKIPFIYFGVEDHADYHQPTDDFAKINQEFYIHAVETILEAVKGFDKDLK